MQDILGSLDQPLPEAILQAEEGLHPLIYPANPKKRVYNPQLHFKIRHQLMHKLALLPFLTLGPRRALPATIK